MSWIGDVCRSLAFGGRNGRACFALAYAGRTEGDGPQPDVGGPCVNPATATGQQGAEQAPPVEVEWGPGRPPSTLFFLVLFVVTDVVSIVFRTVLHLVMGTDLEPQEAMKYSPFLAGGALLEIIVFVVLVIFIYKIWAVLPEGVGRTTPGKAAGYLFIPIFNIYWFFPVIWGWAVDFNRYVVRYPALAWRASEDLGLATAIIAGLGDLLAGLLVAGGMPVLGGVLELVGTVCVAGFVYHVCGLVKRVRNGNRVVSAT